MGSGGSRASDREAYDVAVADVAIIGGGPAGLSAGLQLVRANRRVAILDSNRPRHASTLHSHGFLTRDGAPPLELRRIGREEFETYPDAEFFQSVVREVLLLTAAEAADAGFGDGIGFRVAASGVRGAPDTELLARRVLIAAGLREELPSLPLMRAFYGTALHSCIECDGYEKRGEPLALIGETPDLFERALRVGRFSDDLIVFTNGSDAVTEDEEARLSRIGIAVERRPIDDLVGERAEMTGIRLEDGETVARSAGFVRPLWQASVEFATGLSPSRDADGLLDVDGSGETSVRGVYAAGDVVPPGPQQLVIAAGDGARVAARIDDDLLRAAVDTVTGRV